MFFFEFNERLTELYPEMYRGGGGAQSESIADFGTKWGWYNSLYQLAQGDIRRFEEVTELKLFECLTFLSFEADKNRLEADLIKKKR